MVIRRNAHLYDSIRKINLHVSNQFHSAYIIHFVHLKRLLAAISIIMHFSVSNLSELISADLSYNETLCLHSHKKDAIIAVLSVSITTS